ncbi:sodium-independent anion transporter [Bacillus cereus]|nr:sodium-independent anion transporter [Bacillus cereus]
MAKIHVKHLYIENKKIYEIHGQLFFTSTTDFINAFSYNEDAKEIEMDFTHAHVWDDSAVAAIDKVIMKYEQSGVKIRITGLNERSSKIVSNLATYNKRIAS